MSVAVSPLRVGARVDGTVQGVGFRPFVFRLAGELGLAGHVLNDERGVELEVEGDAAAVELFFERLVAEAPPLAEIEGVSRRTLPPRAERGFAIGGSAGAGLPDAPVAPDSATCDHCLAELFDPGDRRFRYPFVNCTDCGPRFTIVRGVPYDRPRTTMAEFAMCDRCQAEYEDPADRRFHAQPNACPDCGPAVSPPLEDAVSALLDGRIVAVKGIGGYHLACRADDGAAVARLRARKHRDEKPFALMVASAEEAARLVELGAEELALLSSPARPIVIAPRREEAGVARSVAPRSADLGVMLPYSPLHHLLARDTRIPLVMTSGNVSDEPIAFDDDDARERLAGIADLVLAHDRPIRTRTDDSVIRAVPGRTPILMRRSRGYVPGSLRLPLAAERPILACGAELKSTFCLAKGERAWVGHHVGDLKNYETLCSFTDGVAHFEDLFAVAPEVVAHDLHPDYLSTRYARERDGVEHVAVQHHHAHLAACLAENGERGPAVGAIFDGTGHGTDGTAWGGEILVGGLAGFERAGHLFPVRLPGGDRAVREPWRMACAWLVACGLEPPAEWASVAGLVRSGLASPVTTSAGRLFDAVSALCGMRTLVSYEGQAAAELEGIYDPLERGSYPMPLTEGDDGLVIDARETVRAVVGDRGAGVRVAAVAARFHNALADATSAACARVAEAHGLATVVLSGGVFQNRLLLARTADGLERLGLRVLVPERLPPNDGGIAYGQAAIAAYAISSGTEAER